MLWLGLIALAGGVYWLFTTANARKPRVVFKDDIARANQTLTRSLPQRLLYFVTVNIWVLTGAYAWIQVFILGQRPVIDRSLMPTYIADAIPFFFLFIALEIVGLYYKGKLGSTYRLNDAVVSVSLGQFQMLTQLFFKGLSIFPYAYIHQHYAFLRLETNVYTWIFCFLLVDHGYYWAHRMIHEWNGGWSGHVVHHNSEEYNLTTALRQASLQPLFTWIFYLPLALICPLHLYAGLDQVTTLYQFWIHTQYVDKCPRWFEAIFNTPSHHRVHHGRNPQYIDKNYAGTFIIWDRLYGTFEPEVEEPVYGVTSQPQTWDLLGIQSWHILESLEAARYVSSFWEKIRVPFDYGPGFNYFILHGDDVRKPPPPITRQTQIRFDAKPSTLALNIYVFVQSLSVLGLVAYILLSGTNEPTLTLVALFNVWAVASFFNAGLKVLVWEVLRLSFWLLLTLQQLQFVAFPGLPKLELLEILPSPGLLGLFHAASLLYVLLNSKVVLASPPQAKAKTK